MGTITVICTTLGCVSAGVQYTVPADGAPVTCGGCHTVLVEAA